jgi:hypothetical protein
MRKYKLYFEKYKNRNENSKNWNGKKVERFDPKNKGGAYSNINSDKRFQGGNKFITSKPFNQPGNKNVKPSNFFNKETPTKKNSKMFGMQWSTLL